MPHRTLLFFLRTLSIMLVSFILLDPVLQVRHTRMVKPSCSVLIDRSLSMELPVRDEEGNSISRIERVRDHFRREQLIETLRSKTDVRFFIFSDHAIPVDPDSIFGSRGGLSPGRTDIVTALRESRDMVPDSDGMIVVTDGRINRGEDLREYRGGDERMLFLGTGEDTGSPDIDIAGIDVPPRIYEGSPIPVSVVLRVRSGKHDTVTLTIAEGDEPIETEIATLESGEFLHDMNLSIPSLSAGRHVVSLEVKGMEGEPYLGNNLRHLVLEVLPSVKRVLVLSTTPRWDLSFLVKTLRALEYLSVDLYLLRPGTDGGVFVSDGDEISGHLSARSLEIARYDLLCLQGDVADPRLPVLTDAIRSFSEPGKGIMLLVTEGVDRSRRMDGPFSDILPATLPESFDVVSGRFDIMPPLDDDTGVTLPLPDLDQSLSYWSSLPPMTGLMKSPSWKGRVITGPVTLLSAKGRQDQEVPVVLVEDRQGFRIISLLGRGFWRWSFHRSLAGEMGSGYRRFVDSLIRWAFQGIGAGEVRLLPVRNCFQQGEPIEFKVEGRNVDEEILLTVESVEGSAPPDTFSYRSREARSMPDFLTIPPRSPGDYRYSYRSHGREMAGQGYVYVDTYSMEFARPQPDNRLLAEAMLSGTGDYADLYAVTSNNLIKYAPFDKIEKFYLITIVMNNQSLLYIMILILLIVEIYLRKSAGFS